MHSAISDYRALHVSAPSGERKPGACRKRFHARKGSQRLNHFLGFPDHNWFHLFTESRRNVTPIHISKSLMNIQNLSLLEVDLFFILNLSREWCWENKQIHVYVVYMVRPFSIVKNIYRIMQDMNRLLKGNLFLERI